MDLSTKSQAESDDEMKRVMTMSQGPDNDLSDIDSVMNLFSMQQQVQTKDKNNT